MKKLLLSASAVLFAFASFAQCDAGEPASLDPQVICPAETAVYAADGTEVIPAAPGGYGIVFTPTTGTGGINAELTLYGITLPYSFNRDLNGILSANSLPPFVGEWSVSGIAYSDVVNMEPVLCDSTLTSFLVTFLEPSDPACDNGGVCPEGEIADCNGNCAPADWVGDGFCDDGSFTHNGIEIFFNCPEFNNDEGDCDIIVDCSTWSDPSPTTGYSDFNTTFGGAPTAPDCAFNEITAFEVWKSEAYAMDNMVAGTCYTFSHCNGPGAGSWIPYYVITDPNGVIEYQGLGDFGDCSITWVAAESGTYLIAINDNDDCGSSDAIDNGYPAITCNASTCNSISVEELNAASFNIFPNPNAGQFVIDYTGENGLATIEVIELSGKIVNSNQVSVTTGSRIDMNVGSVKGMYFVRITMNNASQVHKVVVN